MNGGAALCRIAVVVPEHAAEAFTALDLAELLTDLASRVYDLVVQALMVAFPVIVMEEVRHSPHATIPLRRRAFCRGTLLSPISEFIKK